MKTHKNSPFASELAQVAVDIESDRAHLVTLMKQLDVRVQQWRGPVGSAAEKVWRLKLNGHVLSRSPLSSVVELDALLAGIEAKRRVWLTLRHLGQTNASLNATDLDDLIAESMSQSELLERVRTWAIDQAFTAA